MIHISGCICRFTLGFCKNKKERTETLYQSFSPFMAKDAYFDTGDGCTRWEITVHLAPNVVLAQANDS